MAMFEGYFDESGTHGPVLVVAGYLSRAPQWGQFRREWREALLPDLDPEVIPFHMAEFESRTKPYMRDKSAFLRVVQDWPEEKAAATLNRLTTVIADRAAVGIAVAVILKDYEIVAKEVGEKDNAYTFAVVRCLRHAMRWADAQGEREDFAYIFEAGASGSHGVSRAAARIHGNPQWRERYRFASLTLAPKTKYVQLQASDVGAWEARKYVAGPAFQNRTIDGMRASMQALLQGPPHISEFFNASELRRYAAVVVAERDAARSALTENPGDY